jgi:thioredoxin reductase
VVNERLETEISSIVAAGDIRNGSPQQVAAAVGDGAIAAITTQRFLQFASALESLLFLRIFPNISY